MRRKTHFITIAIGVFLAASVRNEALYMRVDIDNVPVDRLIQNLERLASQNASDTQIRFNLARVHAMAFAQKLLPAHTVQIRKGQEAEGAWFGYEPDYVPFKAVPTNDPALLATARAHLNQAIALYREVVQMHPDNLTAKLGYAWCLDQSGDRGQAISAYRQVLSDAWAKEQRVVAANQAPQSSVQNNENESTKTWTLVPSARLGQSITVEAARYLLPLLDREKDQAEIATLQDRIRLIGMYSSRWITPIVIPLGERRHISDLVNREARIRFDADGTGIKKTWTWITPDAGWLVHAPEKSRPITSALQMFGSVTFWLFWENGYQALRSLDDNGDGTLRGNELKDLAIWRDSNTNGVAEAGEVKALEEWGIVSLSCRHETNSTNPDYVATSREGVTFANGKTRFTYDILLYAHDNDPIVAD